MNSWKKMTTLGVVLSALAVSVIVPSSALALNPNTVAVNCNDPLSGGVLFVLPGDVTFTTSNCTDIEVNGNLIGATSTVVPSSVLSTGSGYGVQMIQNGNNIVSFNIYLADPDITSLSPLELARTEVVSIPATNPDYFIPASGSLGGNNDCGLEISGTAQHPYKAISLTITQAGNFTFRISGTSPNTDLNSNTLELSSAAIQPPIGDPFLAVYSDFNPADPDSGIVGCNDDGDNDPGYMTDGTVYSGVWSQFDATLNPGTYTIVLATYGTYDAATWATSSAGLAQTASIQLWGPPGAITPITPTTPPVEPVLAETGSQNMGFAGIAIGVLLSLAGAIALATGQILRKRS